METNDGTAAVVLHFEIGDTVKNLFDEGQLPCTRKASSFHGRTNLIALTNDILEMPMVVSKAKCPFEVLFEPAFSSFKSILDLIGNSDAFLDGYWHVEISDTIGGNPVGAC